MSSSNLLRPGGRSRPGRLLALLTATAVAASLLSAPLTPTPAAASQPLTPGPDLDPLLGDAEPTAVTLITGDTVHWQVGGDGTARVVEIVQAPRDYPITFDQSGTQDDYFVIPSDVMEHVIAGIVDKELFNIPGLIRQGLDDDTTDELPVIVTFDQNRSAQQLARAADALPAASSPTALENLNGAGVTVTRGGTGAFRHYVFGEPGHDRSARTAGARGLDGAVQRVMLDQMLKVDLAESVPQIGAPRAWQAGYTGEGVTVAVLDTGVDATHPDLAGQVAATANFTEDPDATDTHGHGTHVASTIAGTGAASDGARKGVAPGADLLIGKVCFRNAAGDGVCPTSAIMAGMEWATTQGADIINMSLGGGPTDGTDPLSQLVNSLAAKTGALFVTSAGNFGGNRTVGSPAAADAALAVGAVDKSDHLAGFSSRGPRVGDHAVKPEITAPGVGIVAARAGETGIGTPVDDHYTSVNGTSMASPHVAGAAALLAQSGRDLSGSELKDALVSTAYDSGLPWFQQGTGRVDVSAALDSPVYAQATINFGGVDGQTEQDLTYTNHSDTEITLILDAAVTDINGRDTDAADIALSADTVIVPANGNATVTVTASLDASALPGNAAFGGVVIATADDVELRTGVGFGPPLNEVTVEVLDSNGDHIGSDIAPDRPVLLTHDSLDPEVGGAKVFELGTSEGIATGHVPAGTYTAITRTLEQDPETGVFTRSNVLIELETSINTDTTITLDARDTVPIQVTTPHKAEKRNHEVAVFRDLVGGGTLTTTAGGESYPVYATPTPPGGLAPLGLWVSWTLAEPQPAQPLPWLKDAVELAGGCLTRPFWCYSETPSYVYNLPILYENGIPDDLQERISRRDLVEVPTRYHSDHPDAFVLHQFESLPGSLKLGAGIAVRMWFRPGELTEYMLAEDSVTWLRIARLERRPESEGTLALNMFSEDRFPAAEAGTRRSEERWFEAPLRMGVQDNRDEFLGNPRGVEREATAARGGPDGNLFVPGIFLMDNARGHNGRALDFLLGGPAETWRMWNLDTGVELDGAPVFALAPEKATYRLEQTEQYTPDVAGVFQTGRAATTWVFSSTPSDAQGPTGYRCALPPADVCQIQPLIQLEYDLGLDIHNRLSTRLGAHVFTVTAGHHSKALNRAPVTSMTVGASFDDGQTWREARVTREPKDTRDTGGFLPSTGPYQEFRVVLQLPPLQRTNGFVTLRIQATDANGGTVDQVIHRAYILG